MQGGSGEYGSVSSDEPVTDTNRTFDIEIKPLIDYAPHQTQCLRCWIGLYRRCVLWVVFTALALSFLAVSLPRPKVSVPPPRIDSRLVFYDDFEFLDRSKWNVEQSLYGGGNWEFQYYIDSSSNVYVKNGSLYLKPGLFEQLPPIRTIPNSDVLYNASDVMYGTCEPLPECATFVVPNCTDARFKGCLKIGNATGEIINPVTSGRVNSKSKFMFKYGRIEWRAKSSRGDWLWPALWLLPETSVYGQWPASGEIDVMEARGNNQSYMSDQGKPMGINAVGSTLHFGQIETVHGGWIIADGWMNAHEETLALNGSDFSLDWHVYGLVWLDDQMYTYVVFPDGSERVILDLRKGYKNGFYFPPFGMAGQPGWKHNPYRDQRVNAPFDKNFFLVMNVAVGGQNGNAGFWSQAPWMNCWPPDCYKVNKFWENKEAWYQTWEDAGDSTALIIDWVKVWQ